MTSLLAMAMAISAAGQGGAPPVDSAPPGADTRMNRSSAGDHLVSLDLVRSDIGDALRLLAREGNINLVVGPDVKAEVSLSLKDVPVREAMRSLVEANGFKWTEQASLVLITKPAPDPDAANRAERPPPLETRVFRPRNVNATMMAQALIPALSKWGRISVLSEDSKQPYGLGTSNLNSGGAGMGAGVGGLGGPARASGVPQPQVNTTVIGGGNPPSANPIPGGNGNVIANAENSQILVVSEAADRIDAIGRLIEQLDIPPRQVLIEARLVEMSTELQKRLGIDWNIEVFANGPILNHEVPLYWNADFAAGPSRAIRNGHGAGLSLGVVDFSRFTALLQASQDDNSVRLLANPRLLVYNNHSANILVGEQYPILNSTITDQGTTTESLSGYIPVGVQLSVSPTIMSDGRVSLLVRPSASALGDDVVGTTGLRVARIQTREIDTRVVIRDGETVVLGGLISDRKTNNVRKVPGLGDIPILDIFTRQERPRQERVDLLVFLTVSVERATEMSADEKEYNDRYRPRFRHTDAIDDVPLHFEFPGTQFHERKPVPGDLPDADAATPMSSTPPAMRDQPSAAYAPRPLDHARPVGSSDPTGAAVLVPENVP